MLATASAAAVVFAGMQLWPTSAGFNPPYLRERSIQTNMQVPPAVAKIIENACMDCHSHETRWPWYGRIAPFSWGMVHDLEKARKALNFSEWSVQAGRRPGIAMGYLTAICADVRSGRMPLAKYQFLHPEARLSGTQRDAICAWAQSESQRIRQQRRRQISAVK